VAGKVTVNDKVYIHEFVDIIGHNRAKYMYHMTANFSPMAQEERHQLCYGVWGVVGTTKRWPEVLNIWEEDGFDGLASSFRHEFNHPTLQDPKLAKWWAAAASLRSGGTDRVLIPAPWTRTIEELVADGVRGEVYAHEQIRVPAGSAVNFLEFVREQSTPVREKYDWELAGAWRTAMVDDDECFLLWAIPTWEQWAAFEKGHGTDAAVRDLQRDTRTRSAGFRRFLLVDAELSPMRLGRQPARSDRTEPWDE
jgi:hypothetical protein